MWDKIIEHFATLEHRPLERTSLLVAGLLIFWIIEGAIPLLPMSYKKTKGRHALVNLGFTSIHVIIHTFLALFIVILCDWCRANQFGLVYWLNAGTLGSIIISLLVLDFFGGWLAHMIEHKTYVL